MMNITEELIEDSKFIQSVDGSYAAIEQVVEQPRTLFNSALLDKQEEERKRKLVYVRVSGDNIKRGTHDELLVPDNWD